MTHSITHTETGLTSLEAAKRLIQYGPNRLALKEKKSLLISFLEEFKDLMVIILIVATVISFIAGEEKDGIVIGFIVLLNAIIGFAQKFKAERAVEALKKMIAPQARVMRDGEQKLIPADMVVPGDLVILNEGDIVAADCELIIANEFEVQESILTGESLPVKKTIHQGTNKIFMSTIVTHGSGMAIVTETGMLTAFGRIAKLTTETEKDLSPLEKELGRIGMLVGKITLVLTAILVIFNIYSEHDSFAHAILFAASVAVAAVPEGLPTTITIALALGVQRLARKNAIVKQLSSVETLGATTVIVSDKTGTLTKNEMTVTALAFPTQTLTIEGVGYDPTQKIGEKNAMFENERESISWMCEIANLCNNAKLIHKKEENTWHILGDPTEGALLTLAEKLGRSQKESRKDTEILHEFPFDSVRKRMTVIVKIKNEIYALTKGAPEQIIPICTQIQNGNDTEIFEEEKQTAIENQNETFANQALRVIAFAYKKLPDSFATLSEDERLEVSEVEKDLIYVGLVGMMDPPRPEVPQAIHLARQAGISIYIMTGDNGVTARAVAEKIGLLNEKETHHIITGKELESLTDEKLEHIFASKVPTIFARVSPQDKLRIVSLLKKRGEIVAVTGDGVNDAPALKRADIGVAMGIAGTDVAKEAANMVLADDSFATIVTAIQEGRTIYENMKKFIMYMFSSNTGELIVIMFALLGKFGTPLTAIMILLVNIGTDVLPALALGMEPTNEEYMLRPPRNQKEGILHKSFLRRLATLGAILGLSSFAAYLTALNLFNREIAMTITYATLVIAQVFNALNSRSNRHPAWHAPFSNPTLIVALISTILILILTIELPILQPILETSHLTATQWLMTIAFGSIVWIFEEVRKSITRLHSRNVSRAT